MAETGIEDELDAPENWEDFQDTKFEKRIKILQRDSSKIATRTTAPVVVQEETSRTPYQPQLKILKRSTPDQHAINDKNSDNARPQKSLEQREAEYAEARRRILGTEKPPKQPAEKTTDQLSQKLGQVKVTENVVRQPRGPDPLGNRGFINR